MPHGERAAVLIDGNYMRRYLHKHGLEMWDIDFQIFSNALCGDCLRFRTYYYDARPEEAAKNPNYEKEDKFQDSLEELDRFIVRLGRLTKTKYGEPPHQKGVDILLAIDLTELSAMGAVDRIILVTNDSDFKPAIVKAKENLTIVTFAYFEEPGVSLTLRKICDEEFMITEKMVMDAKNPSVYLPEPPE